MKTALTIAGSDSSGGAGIQADLKTMIANNVYGMSAITALTAQNTTGVSSVMEVTPEFLGEEIDMVFQDIYPDAVKIGMVSGSGLIKVIAEKLKEYKAKNIVVDTVMVATSGAKLISDDAIEVLEESLIPLATVITPNIPEAEVLSGKSIKNDATDILYENGKYTYFRGSRIDNPNTHGTGCTLSSAIASNLAKGYGLTESVERAKRYISGALKAGLNLGKGCGPLDHGYMIGEME